MCCRSCNQTSLLDVNPKAPAVWPELASGKFVIIERGGFGFFIFRGCKHQPAKSPAGVTGTLAAAAYMLMALTMSIDVQRHGITFIYDLTNASKVDYPLSDALVRQPSGLPIATGPAGLPASPLINYRCVRDRWLCSIRTSAPLGS